MITASYDYIITGAGCAGLSLLLHLQQHSFFRDKRVLLIDASDKTKNDRTWCFWEKEAGLFEDIVYKRWTQIDFYGCDFSGRFAIEPYVYKMIRGIDLYRYVSDRLKGWPNVHLLQEKVSDMYSHEDRAVVVTTTGTYDAQYVFNSILFHPERLAVKGSLLQHFKGWMITTPDDRFDAGVATFMDFRVCAPEENTFVYLLPVNSRKALVEYTVFSPNLLPEEEYRKGLEYYISSFLHISQYTISEEESGVIPMSRYRFVQDKSAIIHLGTAGGQTKSSSGYTFRFIQKHSAAITAALRLGNHPVIQSRIFDRRFKLYDDTLLDVLYSKKLTASKIFSDMFRRNKPKQILKFLDNETGVAEELKLLASVPSQVFLPAACKQLFT